MTSPLAPVAPAASMPAGGAGVNALGHWRAAPPRAPRPAPETLHPSLWLGHQLGRHAEQAAASGFAALDAQLPGHGWPRRALTELLLAHPGVGEIRLLAPSLAATQHAGRLVMLFDPPAALSAGALAQLGLDVEQLLIIDTSARPGLAPGAARGESDQAAADSRRAEAAANPRRADEAAMNARGANGAVTTRGAIAAVNAHWADEAAVNARLWALEQALKSGHVGAVVAWLPPRLRPERLRRLQVAAQAHDGPAFMLREMAAAQRPTAAPLRLALRPGGADVLSVRVLKRRGPPLETALRLGLPSVLSEAARQRARVSQARVPAPEAREALGVAGGAREASESATPLRAATFVNLAAF